MMSVSNYLTSRAGSVNGFMVHKPILLTSILGRFVRKCRLEYVKLDYEGAGLLWSLFEVYRAPMLEVPKWKDGFPHSRKIGRSWTRNVSQESSNLLLPVFWLIAIVCSSQDDIEKLCRKQIEQLERSPFL